MKESWDQESHPIHSIEEIVSWICETKAPRVVITGGEPLMHKLDAICNYFITKD